MKRNALALAFACGVVLGATSSRAQGQFVAPGQDAIGVAAGVVAVPTLDPVFAYELGWSYRGRVDVAIGTSRVNDGPDFANLGITLYPGRRATPRVQAIVQVGLSKGLGQTATGFLIGAGAYTSAFRSTRLEILPQVGVAIAILSVKGRGGYGYDESDADFSLSAGFSAALRPTGRVALVASPSYHYFESGAGRGSGNEHHHGIGAAVACVFGIDP